MRILIFELFLVLHVTDYNTKIINMNIDNSRNDVVAINSDDEDAEDTSNEKPIIRLFKQLTRDNNQMTVLTNAQIIDILKEEFDINIWNIHELEGEIYVTIMKLYLKNWPLWEEFDKIINNLKTKNDSQAIEEVLDSNYKKLKEYLEAVLAIAKEAAKSKVQNVKDEKVMTVTKDSKPESNVVLQITASRSQLNKLFFRRPPPKLNNTIFNCTKHVVPTHIVVNQIPMEAILNWWGISITIKVVSSKISVYERHTRHELKHVLVNKNLMYNNEIKELDQEIKVRLMDQVQKPTSEFVDLLTKMSHQYELKEIYQFIKKDLMLLPKVIITRNRFRRYTNKYPYSRYLYEEVKKPDVSSKKYDIQLQETLSPMYEVYIRMVTATNTIMVVECESCGVKFLGPNLIQELREHFDEFHLNEPDWTCTKCDKKFTMVALAQNWWCHRC